MSKRNKKNFLRVPDVISAKANLIESDSIIVAHVQKYDRPFLESGMLSHLGIHFENGNLVMEPEVLSPPSSGRYSKWNVQGKIVIRKDLPKAPKNFSWEAPNFGDWSNGSHTVRRTIDVYQRDFLGPKAVPIKVTLLSTEAESNSYVMRFQVQWALNKSSTNFEEDLLFCLNLLQENVGNVDIFDVSTTDEQYLQSIWNVAWNLLPPGKQEEVLIRVFGTGKRDTAESQIYQERMDLLAELKPVRWIVGTSGFQRYFGAQFADDLVVLECMRRGNAIYVMFENWSELSQLSRLELLNKRSGEYERIVHRAGWQVRLKRTIQDALQ